MCPCLSVTWGSQRSTSGLLSSDIHLFFVTVSHWNPGLLVRMSSKLQRSTFLHPHTQPCSVFCFHIWFYIGSGD